MITQEGFAEAGPDAAADAAGGTILESGQAPPLTPRDGISRKGKPLAPMKDTDNSAKAEKLVQVV